MPLYEYECQYCEYTWEEYWPIKDRDCEEALYCANCFGKAKRLVGNKGGFRLLGSCWSEDGYSTLLGDAHKFKTGRKP